MNERKSNRYTYIRLLNPFRYQSSVAKSEDLRPIKRLLWIDASMPHNSPPKPGQGPGRTRLLWVAVAALAAIFLSRPIGAEPPKEIRRILILNEVGTSYPGITIINEGIQAALNDSPYRLEFYSEYMETGLFPNPADQQEFRDFYLRRYQNRKPDVIITVGPSPLKFMQEVHQAAFPGVSIVFCLPTRGMPGAPALDSDFTGVENDMDPAKTLEIALRLQPGAEHVIVVGGAANYDRQQVANVKKELKAFTNHLDISYVTELAMPDLLERLRHLPSHTLVLLTSVSMDAAGTRFKGNETGTMVSAAANAPVFSLFDVYLNHGEVGGYLSSLREQGKVAGGMALRLLSGAKPQAIPRVTGVNTYMFDWRALKRWGLRESDLPPGSVVLFREISVWQRTKGIWASVLLIILGLSLLAIYLHRSRAELKKARDAQVQLSAHLVKAQEKERSRVASELHDDFSQRLALLAFGLQNTAETFPDSDALKQTLDEFRQSVCELGDDLHNLSHQLHSSTLDTLGLVTGLRALSREFGAKQGIEIDFTSDDIPRTVRPEVSLCLFRITQEGLQNLKKHSGTKKAQLSLRHMGDRLFLSLCDEGMGFDAYRMEKPGLGILSMQGRARLLGGDFEIHSTPGKGTRIGAWVPLQPVGDPLNV
jgi:signal transduction histidine kinase